MEPITCPHSTCGYTWTPRKANPKKCPQCQNSLWRSPMPKRARSDNGSTSDLQSEGGGSIPSASTIPEPECVRAPEKDSLSQRMRRAEELFARIAQ